MNNPSVSDFKSYFDRDFPYGSTDDTVKDTDIIKALAETAISFNEAIWESQATYTIGFEYLAAHNLVMNLRASSQGIAGQFSWLQASKGAGSVNEGFAIPERILKNPFFAMLSKTTYGAKYLQMILPRCKGVVMALDGSTMV